MNDTTKDAIETLDIHRLMELLPHRYPFLLVDKLNIVEDGKFGIGIKNVTFNEDFFQGHFPGQPVMPGVLIIEALAQTAIALVKHSPKIDTEGKIAFFASMDKVKFRRSVIPGDVLELHVEFVKARGPLWKFQGKAMVDGDIAAEADYSAMAVDEK